MGKRSIVVTAIMAFATVAIAACSGDTKPPLIFAAASLVDVMDEIGDEYERTTGETVRFSFGGSNLLANQINAGASASAVIVAGGTPIHKLVERGKAREGEGIAIFTNRLVVVGSSGSNADIADLKALVGAGRIAMPDPSTAPAGEYFEIALRRSGRWDELQSQIIPMSDVRAALAAVTTGNVAYAFVYESDALSTDNVEIAFTIDSGSEATVPKYYASRLSDDHSADQFLEFLTSPSALSIIESYGFNR